MSDEAGRTWRSPTPHRRTSPSRGTDACRWWAEAAGATNIQPFAFMNRIPGFGIHEMGVARMGTDPKTSVLSQYQQAWGVDNLFVMDAAGFTSGACQNPTLTIMALTVRSTDYLMDEMRKGNL